MILLHIALANLRYRLHRLADRLYDWTHEPDHLGDWADVLHAENQRARAEKAATADDTNPHTPVTTVHRPAIYVDADGQTVVRDRWGTAVANAMRDLIARAKREERERVGDELEAAATGMGDDLDDYGRGLRNGLRLASRRASKDGGA